MNLKSAVLTALITGFFLQIFAAVIGTNTPATPLTDARVANLPAWKNYLERSINQRQADQDFLRAEMKAHEIKNSSEPAATRNAHGVSLDKPAAWYGSDAARRIAEIIVSFQTPAGGWSKNTDFTKAVRAPGEGFAADNSSRMIVADDFDRAETWNYIGTFDNDATTTELRFLAKVISADKNNSQWKKSFARGLDYIFAAQFPNGGWPQVWPLQGGYHDAITFNDDAMLHIIEFLQDVAGGQNEFSFVPAEVRAQAGKSCQRGIDCILAAQIIVNGTRTVWCQQHDALTLQPVSARNYEMPAAASGESAAIVLFLMQLPDPTPREVAAVQAATAWFKKTKIENKQFKSAGEGRKLLDAPGAGPLWARYYQIGTDLPIFGDRDKSIHDNVDEISRERRNGYGWFNNTAKRVLEHYPKWAKAHPLPS